MAVNPVALIDDQELKSTLSWQYLDNVSCFSSMFIVGGNINCPLSVSYQYPGLLRFKCLICFANCKLWQQCDHTPLQTCRHSKLTKMWFNRMGELWKGTSWQCHCFCGKISRPGKVTFTVVFKPPETNNTNMLHTLLHIILSDICCQLHFHWLTLFIKGHYFFWQLLLVSSHWLTYKT